MKEFNERLKELRKASGLTQSDLAEKLNVHLQTVSKWERGLSKPCEVHLERLVALLGLPVESTMAAEEKRVAPKATFFSIVRNEFVRIFATSVMIAVCVCNLAGTISTDSTVVSLGFSVALFCFGTMVKG